MDPKHPFETEFNSALDSWHGGEQTAAVKTLESLASRYPDVSPIRGMLGGYLHDLGRHGEALPHCEAATVLSPKSELASITLFHVLYALGRREAAWAEALRFVTLRPSEEYESLFAESGYDPRAA